MDRLAAIVRDVHFQDVADSYNHCQFFAHFAHFVLCNFVSTLFLGGSCQGTTADVSYQPKYKDNVYKITVAIDLLGRIVAWTGPDVGAKNDGRIYSGHQFATMPALLEFFFFSLSFDGFGAGFSALLEFFSALAKLVGAGIFLKNSKLMSCIPEGVYAMGCL